MVNWLSFFLEIATVVRREVQPLFGTTQAKKTQGRGAGGDVVRLVDALAESIVLRTLEKENVPCVLVSEECGTRYVHGGGLDYVVLDAIDGTTNALHRIPFVAISIAHASGPLLSDVDVSLVMDLNDGTVFTTQKGQGAYQGDVRLNPSGTCQLKDALISMELTYRIDLRNLTQRLTPVIKRASKIRSLGSTALETVYVASGRIDAFIDLRGLTRAVDLAAATLIVREAQAVIVTPDGKELDMGLKTTARTSFIVAGNNTLLAEILRLLQ